VSASKKPHTYGSILLTLSGRKISLAPVCKADASANERLLYEKVSSSIVELSRLIITPENLVSVGVIAEAYKINHTYGKAGA